VLGVAAGVVLAVVAVLIASASGGDGGGAEASTTTVHDAGAADFPDFPHTPTNVTATVEGSVYHLTWQVDDAQEGDTYLVIRGTDGQAYDRVEQTEAFIEDATPGERACWSVIVERGVRQSDRSAEACA
jgi:hypothetical protein